MKRKLKTRQSGSHPHPRCAHCEIWSCACGKPTDASIKSLVKHYEANHKRLLEEDLTEFARGRLDAVIDRAACGNCRPARRHRHQWQIARDVLGGFATRLCGRTEKVRSAKNFAELWAVINEKRKTGIGPLAVYDTALRIGWKLGKLPENTVFLQCGAVEGARRLGITGITRVSRDDFRLRPLRDLPAYHIENFLCMYKDDIPEDHRRAPYRVASRTVARKRRARL